MILYISYEEVRALRLGARSFLRDETHGMCAVAAPPAARAEISALEERLVGDLDVDTLGEQRALVSAVSSIVECLRVEMETLVGETHPAHEGAVAAYFDYAHSLSVLQRLREMGSEMEAMIEVMTGWPVDGVAAASFHFPIDRNAWPGTRGRGREGALRAAPFFGRSHMTEDRIGVLERMLGARPEDARLRFGLALEYDKAGRTQDAVRELRAYLDQSEDQGNAWGRLGAMLTRLGREDEAREAYRRGVEQATKHGHPTMAAELEAALGDR